MRRSVAACWLSVAVAHKDAVRWSQELEHLVAQARAQASSSRSRFDAEIESKNRQLKHFRDDVEEMMIAIEVR